ncbi:MAG: shikimate kinase [Clostridia bacterium]|nr:shikimate kinase [Clostridia bacterium]
MNSKRFGLIGGVLGHSFSPQIHALLGDYEYKLYELKREEIGDFFKNSGLDGFNVTIPYKQDVIPFCAEISDRARRIGSVNTVVRRADGSFFGDNTDYFGFSTLLGETDGKGKAIILGSGGSSKTVKTVLEDRGYSPVVVISRSGEDNYTNLARHYDAKLIVNTTPVGMYPHNGEAPIKLDKFRSCMLVIDLIYNPSKTALVLEAEKLGIEARGGLLMLAAQGKMASEIFLDTTIDDKRSYEVRDALERTMKNIILIGMPGSGKSTIGRALAERCSREFVDTDELFREKYGIGAGEMIEKEGVAAFRRAETALLGEVCKRSGIVIATGGGVVTIDENYDLMHQNGTIVFVDRDVTELCTYGRPLSAKHGVEKLYNERIGRYNSWCDFKFRVHGIEETASDIFEKIV